MNSEFCMQCGSKVEFSLKAPNFCPSCGNKFNEGVEASIVENANVIEAEPESAPLPNISKLEYSIGGMARAVTFGDLAAQTQSSPDPYEKREARPPPAPVAGEDILKTTMAECASARHPKDVSD